MYKKWYIVFFVFVLLSVELGAQSISLFDFKLDEYPKVTAKIHTADQNGDLIDGLSPLDFDIYENNEQQTINNVLCSPNDIIREASVVVSIDRSSYWSENDFNRMKIGFSQFIKILYLDNSEVAVNIFNQTPQIVTHFIFNESELTSAIENISPSGVPFISGAIVNEDIGMLKVSEVGMYDRKHLVLIANRHDEIDFDAISDSLEKYNLVLHALFNESKEDDNWGTLVESSGGNYLIGINSLNDWQQAFLKVARDIQNIEPCEIVWRHESCDTIRFVEIEISDYDIENEVTYYYLPGLLPYIQFSDLGYLEYGLLPKDSRVEKTISITAKNTDIHIKNILRSSTLFTITDYGGSPPEFTLAKDETRQIRIEFFALDTHYIHSEFEIVTEICGSNKFYVSAGSKKGTVIKETIEVIEPNGGEELVAGAEYPIKWGGILPVDTVYIDLSKDNEATWNPIVRKTTGLEYQWQVPNISSDECLVRVDHISRSDNYEKIHFLEGHVAGINGLSWSPLGSTLASSANDDSIKIWDPINEILKQTIHSADETLYSSHWSPNSEEYIITTVNKPYGLIFISDRKDSVHALEGIVKVAKWSSGGSSKLYVSCGTDEGKVYIWEYRGTQREPVFVSELAGHDGEITDISWNNFSSIVATTGRDGKLILWNPITGEIIKELKDYDYALSSISWSPNGDYIACAGDNNIIDVWDVENEIILSQPEVSNQGITEVEWDPGNNWIAAASAHDVYLWNVSDYSLYYIYTIHDNKVSVIEWRDDSQYIASGDLNSSVQIWDPTQIPFENHVIQSDISDDVFSIVDPRLTVNDIIFNPRTMNEIADSVFTGFIRNGTDYPIRIDSIIIEDPMNGIFIVKSMIFPITLEPQSELDVEFAFRPPQNNLFSGQVQTYTQNQLYRSSIAGRGLPIKLVPEKDQHDLGDILLSESVESTLSIVRNISLSQVHIRSINLITLTGEFSIIDNPNSTILDRGEELELTIRYEPDYIGPSSAIIRIAYDNLDSIITVGLNGNGVAPFYMIPDIDFGNIECSNARVDSSFVIKNTGKGELRISDIMIVGNNPDDFDFSFDSFDPIRPDEERTIIISFVPTSTGPKSAELIIGHNRDEQYLDSHSYLLSASSDSVAFQLEKDVLLFDDIGAFETKRETFTVSNTGNRLISWDIPVEYEYFTIESIEPNPTPANETSIVTVLFKGGKEDTTYIQKHEFFDQCNNFNEIQFIANTGKENPIANLSDELNFAVLVCESNLDTAFVIQNIGSSALIVSEIKLDESSDEVFSLCDQFEELTIPPGESEIVNICVSASQSGFFTGKLIVTSNSTTGTTIEIPITAQREIYLYELSPPSVEFTNITATIEYLDTIVVFNKGTIPIEWQFPVTSDKFILENVTPQITQPSGFSEIVVRFIGGEKGEIYNAVFPLPDSCDLGLELNCQATVKGSNYAVLTSSNTQARPGEIVSIPIIFSNPENIALDEFDGVETKISFDASLLFPVDEKYSGSIIRGRREIELAIDTDVKVGNIFQLDCIAALGNKKITEIIFSDTKPIGTDKYFMESESGTFELIIDCEDDPNKFIDDAGIVLLSEAKPNPANDLVQIDFHVIEKGRCRIELFDIYGSKIDDLFDEFVASGSYSIMFDVDNLPSGNYIYKMSTFSQTFVRKLIIIK